MDACLIELSEDLSMTDRIYRTFLGLAILLALYFESVALMYSLVAMLLLEGVIQRSVPQLVGMAGVSALAYRPEPCNPQPRFGFEGELMWRMVVAVVLALTYYFYEYLWFFPWFMGFAIFGAGLSGICPVLMAIRWVGFK